MRLFGLNYNHSKSRDVIFSEKKTCGAQISQGELLLENVKKSFSELSLPGVEIVPTSCTSILRTIRASHLPYNAKIQKIVEIVYFIKFPI